MVLPRYKSLAFASALALSGALFGVSADAENLEEAVVSALNYHPSVEAAIANRDAYIEERSEQWADYFPTLNVRATGGRAFGETSTKSKPSVCAFSRAFWRLRTPTCSPSESITRTSLALIRSLIRVVSS